MTGPMPKPKIGERWRVIHEGRVEGTDSLGVRMGGIWHYYDNPNITWEKLEDPEPPWMSIVSDNKGWAWQNVEGTWHCDLLRSDWQRLCRDRGPITILRNGCCDA